MIKVTQNAHLVALLYDTTVDAFDNCDAALLFPSHVFLILDAIFFIMDFFRQYYSFFPICKNVGKVFLLLIWNSIWIFVRRKEKFAWRFNKKMHWRKANEWLCEDKRSKIDQSWLLLLFQVLSDQPVPNKEITWKYWKSSHTKAINTYCVFFYPCSYTFIILEKIFFY